MNLARKIEAGRTSLEVFQGSSQIEEINTVFGKYDNLMEILGEDHQLALDVLQDVKVSKYRARTPVKQELLDSIFTTGAGLLRVVDRDMLKLASVHGNFEGNAIYGSLGRLRETIQQTIVQYTRMDGSR